MTRRKQNAPQRLKSEDEDEVGGNALEVGTMAADSTNGDSAVKEDQATLADNMDVDESESCQTAEEKTEDMDMETDNNKQQSEHTEENSEGESEVIETKRSDAVDVIKSEINHSPNECSKDDDDNSEMDTNMADRSPGQECLQTASSRGTSPSPSTDRCNSEYSTDQSKLETGTHVKSEHVSKYKKDIVSTEPNPSRISPTVSQETESPITKLLNMVNNPEKLQPSSKLTSNSYKSGSMSTVSTSRSRTTSVTSSLSMATGRMNSYTSPLSSGASVGASFNPSSVTSKPLSGFLPPYSVYAHFQRMYASMSKLFDHSALYKEASEKGTKDMPPTSRKRSYSPAYLSSNSPKSSSSPASSPVPTHLSQDQPLDLSVKSAGLDLSTKSNSVPERSKWFENEPYIQDSRSDSTSVNADSSLKSLEEKFGSGSSFKLDSGSSQTNASTSKPPSSLKPPYVPFMHHMLPMYGGSLYASALFNSHPWMQFEKSTGRGATNNRQSSLSPSQKSTHNNHTFVSCTRTNSMGSSSRLSPSVSSPSPKNAAANSKCRTDRGSSKSSTSGCKNRNSSSSPIRNGGETSARSPASAAAAALLGDKELLFNRKYTNLKCACAREFETLYDLTLHVKESGHTPCSRLTEQHEFPKLVRGQDMWLNHGSEQTKQILRCIRCGESFRSLPDLTVHMMKTKHYTNIVGSNETTCPSRKSSTTTPPSRILMMPSGLSQETYRCFECDEPFVGMEAYSKHVYTSGHHKTSPIVIQPTNLVSPHAEGERDSRNASPDDDPRTRVRRLSKSSDYDANVLRDLSKMFDFNEFRARYEHALRVNGFLDMDDSSMDSFTNEENKVRCETCLEKIEMSRFVDHVRGCIHKYTPNESSSAPFKKRRLDYGAGAPSDTPVSSSLELSNGSDIASQNAKGQSSSVDVGSDSRSPPPLQSCVSEAFLQPDEDEEPKGGSALKAMENFIERSFTPAKATSLIYNGRYSGTTGLAATLHSNVSPRMISSYLTPSFPLPSSFPMAAMSSSKSPRATPPSSNSTQLYDKYLPPLFVTDPEGSDKTSDTAEVKKEKSIPSPVSPPVERRIKVEKDKDVLKDNRASTDPQTERSTIQISNARESSPTTQIKSEMPSPQKETVPTKASADICHNTSPRKISESSSHEPKLDVQKDKYDEPENNYSKHLESVNITAAKKVNALASLQGLVYGQTLETKNPLDSLQNLIQRTNNPRPTHSSFQDNSMCSKSNVDIRSPSMPQEERKINSSSLDTEKCTRIERSETPPKVDSVEGTFTTNNNLPVIKLSENTHKTLPLTKLNPESPSIDIDKRERDISSSPSSPSCTQNSQVHRPNSPMCVHPSENDSKPKTARLDPPVGDNNEYSMPFSRTPLIERCKAAKLNSLSATKLSNGSPKKRENGGHIKKAPFIYLPLDHSSKFNKYYEMATELASKTK